MDLTSRPFDPEHDLPAVAALFDEVPASTRHVVDFPWRLSSPVGESGQNARLWGTDNDHLVGLAAWQVPWAALDLAMHRETDLVYLECLMLDWAERRFTDLDAARGHPLPYWVEVYADDSGREARLRARGYVLVDTYQYVELARSSDEPLPPSELPQGFVIRPLDGFAEVPAYVEAHRPAFNSTSMTVPWRTRTLRMPAYVDDLDLVAEAPDGRVAGFCVGWLAPGRRTGQIEPIGVAPAFQRRGVGRALLVEILRRFRNLGAQTVLFETDSARLAALRAYESIGFRPTRVTRRLGRLMT